MNVIKFGWAKTTKMYSLLMKKIQKSHLRVMFLMILICSVHDLSYLDYTIKKQALRTACPRMPWHDIMCSIKGSAVMDVVHHFIQRYNANKVSLDQL